MKERPIVGHWYSGATKRPNPRRVVAVQDIAGGYLVYYRTAGGQEKSCWCSTWEQWATKDLGPDCKETP